MKSDKDGFPVEKNPFKCRFCRIQVAHPDLWYPDKNLKSVSVLIRLFVLFLLAIVLLFFFDIRFMITPLVSSNSSSRHGHIDGQAHRKVL
jgi:hypothetical protein